MRADVTDGGSRSDTPLHWAAGAGHVSLCSILLENGADLTRCNSEGGSKPRSAWVVLVVSATGRYTGGRVVHRWCHRRVDRPMFSKLGKPKTRGRVPTERQVHQTFLKETLPRPFAVWQFALSLVWRSRVWRSWSRVCGDTRVRLTACAFAGSKKARARSANSELIVDFYTFLLLALCRSECPPRSKQMRARGRGVPSTGTRREPACSGYCGRVQGQDPSPGEWRVRTRFSATFSCFKEGKRAQTGRGSVKG